MSHAVFISYRRRESLVEARAVYERLRAEFGHQNVFIDLEGLDYGVDFVDVLERQLHFCKVMLALVGPGWLGADPEGRFRRIDDENDFVRIELRTALKRGIRVIPILLNGASLPISGALPADIQSLVRRQALELDFRRFDADIGRLVAAMKHVLSAAPTAEVHSSKPSVGGIPSAESAATGHTTAPAPPQTFVDPSPYANAKGERTRIAARHPEPSQAWRPQVETAKASVGATPTPTPQQDSPQKEQSSPRRQRTPPTQPPTLTERLLKLWGTLTSHPDPTIALLRRGMVTGAAGAIIVIVLAILLGSLTGPTDTIVSP